MKRMKYFAVAAVLLCLTGLCVSCSSDDDDTPIPAPIPEKTNQEEIDRNTLVSHIESDVKLLADNLNAASLNATSQALTQLISLMESDKNIIANIKKLLSAISQKKALLSVSPVKVGSELAKMGYLAYITADNSDFGVRVVFDGKGDCRVVSNDRQEFIFPATVDGIGTTLFKLIIDSSDDSYQMVADANLPNMKRLAYVSRLPKTYTLTLNALIDSNELTLSESAINLELPLIENSEYVNLDACSFKISGIQDSYLNDDKSFLDYRLIVEDKKMSLIYGFTHNGAGVITCDAEMELPQTKSFIGQMGKSMIDIATLKAITIRMLDDLTFTGTITDGAAFAQNFAKTLQNRQQDSSGGDLSAAVAALNSSCQLQLSCPQTTKPETVNFCAVQRDGKSTIEPGLKNLESNDYIPISQLLSRETMEYIDKPFKLSYTPSGNSTSAALRFYSVLMQMMPINN